jgi:hypothetical protein
LDHRLLPTVNSLTVYSLSHTRRYGGGAFFENLDSRVVPARENSWDRKQVHTMRTAARGDKLHANLQAKLHAKQKHEKSVCQVDQVDQVESHEMRFLNVRVTGDTQNCLAPSPNLGPLGRNSRFLKNGFGPFARNPRKMERGRGRWRGTKTWIPVRHSESATLRENGVTHLLTFHLLTPYQYQ